MPPRPRPDSRAQADHGHIRVYPWFVPVGHKGAAKELLLCAKLEALRTAGSAVERT